MTAADERPTETGAPPERSTGPEAPLIEPQPSPQPPRDGDGDGDSKSNELFRQLAAVLANATVITALLVYFGWQRSEVQAQRLGIDESILGMSTRDYVLRSVESVLWVLLIIGVVGLLWLRLDHWLVRRLRARALADPVIRYSLRLLPFAWLVLPAIVRALWGIWQPTAYVVWPFSIGTGVLLVLYGAHLRGMLPGADALAPGRQPLLRGFTAIIVGVTLFWGVSRYATVLGDSLADDFTHHVAGLTQVAAYSSQRLHLTAPGVRETELTGDKSAYRYRYTGLRLLEHTGGHYFLISDGWSQRYGVVIVLADSDPVRLEFVRDRR